MKKNLLFLIILISVIGCKESKNQQVTIEKKEPEIAIDTTKKGNLGEPKSSVLPLTLLYISLPSPLWFPRLWSI